ncbi:MAG: excinuclease ABC subunit UvrC [Deltaproteobacteria bacterium]|nr:excinuclease ABC subunit UvrC [Deltaproteobacteria bacterium]
MKTIPNFPESPGVYLMKDASGRVLYVGKAKNLKKRVASYFGRESDNRYQIKFLMGKVENIDFITTRTEKEALLLEYKLIKEHKPKYNIELKDSKTFVRIKLSTNHPFPGIYITRKVQKTGAEYFGPYVSPRACRVMLNQAVQFFKLRTCSDMEFSNRSRPCIQYDIGRCTAPCVGYVSKDDYAMQADDAILFLNGKKKDLIFDLKAKMRRASGQLKYEDAAHFRDIIKDVRYSIEKQSVMKPEDVETPAVWDEAKESYDFIIGQQLKKRLHLLDFPHFIECVDISNIGGKIASGAIVCFLNGSPMKSRYRLFNITKSDAPSDYAMMHEVLERRFAHPGWELPELLLVDGGKGQLSIASKVLADLNVHVSVAAVAKISGSHKKSSDKANIYLPGRVNEVKFKRGDPALLYLIRIRDEAHRFSIKHYRRRHEKF